MEQTHAKPVLAKEIALKLQSLQYIYCIRITTLNMYKYSPICNLTTQNKLNKKSKRSMSLQCRRSTLH